MMTQEQQDQAVAWAEREHCGNDEIAIDINKKFAKAEDAVWVRAWIRVPASEIFGYSK